MSNFYYRERSNHETKNTSTAMLEEKLYVSPLSQIEDEANPKADILPIEEEEEEEEGKEKKEEEDDDWGGEDE